MATVAEELQSAGRRLGSGCFLDKPQTADPKPQNPKTPKPHDGASLVYNYYCSKSKMQKVSKSIVARATTRTGAMFANQQPTNQFSEQSDRKAQLSMANEES